MLDELDIVHSCVRCFPLGVLNEAGIVVHAPALLNEWGAPDNMLTCGQNGHMLQYTLGKRAAKSELSSWRALLISAYLFHRQCLA